jgi:hypothetical protein
MFMSDFQWDDLSSLSSPQEIFFLRMPDAIDLHEPIKKAELSDHEITLTPRCRNMMRKAITDTSRFTAIPIRRRPAR